MSEHSLSRTGIRHVSLLVNFLHAREADLSHVVFQRIHLAGRFRRGVAPDGQLWKLSPIIVGFRDGILQSGRLSRRNPIRS